MAEQMYGTKVLKWSTGSAPNPYEGIVENWTYGKSPQMYKHPQGGDIGAAVLHSMKMPWSFSTTMLSGHVGAWSLQNGCKVVITGLNSGTVLCNKSRVSYRRNRPTTASPSGVHYPDVTGGAGGSAGLDLTAPGTDAAAGLIFLPTSKLLWGAGLTSAAGIVDGFDADDAVQLQEETEGGKIINVIAHSFERSVQLDIVTVAGATLPASGDPMPLEGTPLSLGVITTPDEKYASQTSRTFSLKAIWLPAAEAGEEE